MSTEETPFERKLRERQAARGLPLSVPLVGAPARTAPPKPVSASPALAHEENVPSAEDLGFKTDPEQAALDLAIEQIGIVEAYMRWCKKMVPKAGTRQTEGIKVSCPNPQHPDKNPSAWLNTDKDVWHCAACDQGGDRWDMAAWFYGFPVPGYKDPIMFRQLREKIAAELGFSLATSITGKTLVMTPAQIKQAEEDEAREEEERKSAAAKVGKLPSAVAAEQAEEDHRLAANAPTIDWRAIVPEDTFLREYLNATSIDTSPEEFHFWNGMLALGLAVGRDVTLDDAIPVVPNLFVCLTGPSGSGKSRAIRHLETVLRAVIPYNDSVPVSRGAKIIKSPGSAEYLIFTFQSIETDPTNPNIKHYFPVRGLVQFDELSTLAGMSARAGNNLKPQLMEVYDANKIIESGSLTGGLRRAESPFGSLVSTTQNHSLRRLLDTADDGSGFINRWMFAQGKLKKRMSIGRTAVDLAEAGKKLLQIHQWSFNGKNLDLTPDAFKMWDEFFHSTVDPSQSAADRLGTSVLGRIDLLMKKLILLFAINSLESEVSVQSVQRAIDLWPYLIATYGVVGVEMVKTSTTDLQDEILKQIERLHQANGRGPTKKMIYDSVKRKLKNMKELADLLTIMIKLELVIEKQNTGVGRPGMRYEVAS